MRTGRNRFLKINRGLKNGFSFKWKQKRRHRALNFSKWNQNLKSSCVQSRLLSHSHLFQLPPHFPTTAMLTYCLFSLIRHPSRKLFIAAVSHSLQQGMRSSCMEHFAICSGLGLTYIACLKSIPYAEVPLLTEASQARQNRSLLRY